MDEHQKNNISTEKILHYNIFDSREMRKNNPLEICSYFLV